MVAVFLMQVSMPPIKTSDVSQMSSNNLIRLSKPSSPISSRHMANFHTVSALPATKAVRDGMGDAQKLHAMPQRSRGSESP